MGKDGGCVMWQSSACPSSPCIALSKMQLSPEPQVYKMFQKRQSSGWTPLPIKLARNMLLAVETQSKDNLCPSLPSKVSCWTMVSLFVRVIAAIDTQWIAVCVQVTKSYRKYKEIRIFIEGYDASSLFSPRSPRYILEQKDVPSVYFFRHQSIF